MSESIFLTVLHMFNVIMVFALLSYTFWLNTVSDKNYLKLAGLLIIVLILLVADMILDTDLSLIISGLLILMLFFNLKHQYRFQTHSSQQREATHVQLQQQINLAKEKERSRIYANLHDDVGAKLLELIYAAPDDQSKTTAKQVLNHIRQAVASTQNIQLNVKQLADDLLTEFEQRFMTVNIKQSKQVIVDDENKKLAMTVPSVIVRVIREAISNVIKHAGATEVQFNFKLIDSKLTIKICDNGIGFLPEQKNGKGLKTIKKRAESIGAQVKWSSNGNKGTCFMLNYQL